MMKQVVDGMHREKDPTLTLSMGHMTTSLPKGRCQIEKQAGLEIWAPMSHYVIHGMLHA